MSRQTYCLVLINFVSLLMIKYFLISSSLSSPCPLYGLLGNLPVENSHAKFLLTCKYVITKTLSEPRILVGYLTSNESLRTLLIDLLLVALRLWADGSALRHMTELQHRRLSGMVAIATTCVDIQQSPKKQQGVINIHILIYDDVIYDDVI